MLLAGSVCLEAVLARLAALRPVFHSEADFQQAFAWEVRMQNPTVRVRLETRPAPGMRLDLLLTSEDGRRRSVVELKYLTRLWTGDVAGEQFELKNQGAQDIRAHDVVKTSCGSRSSSPRCRIATARWSALAMTLRTGTSPCTAIPPMPTRSASTREWSCTGRGRGAH